MVKPAERKAVVSYFIEHHTLSIRQACQLSHLPRSGYYYRRQEPREQDEPIICKLQELAEEYPTYGFWKMHYRLRQQGFAWNHKRVYRLYKALKLHLKRPHKRRLPLRILQPLTEPDAPNEVWSMDFMSDALYHGPRFRVLNIIDDYNRELCWIELGLTLSAQKLIAVLEQVIEHRAKPQQLRVDNGPEFTSACFMEYCQNHNIHIHYIQPGKPTQNAFIERFNRSYRTEVLDAYLFQSIQQVKDISYDWAHDYNHHRPHQSLNHLPPIPFAKQSLKC